MQENKSFKANYVKKKGEKKTSRVCFLLSTISPLLSFIFYSGSPLSTTSPLLYLQWEESKVAKATNRELKTMRRRNLNIPRRANQEGKEEWSGDET